ncbi:MAG: class I SAM-dependent methyltransferase [Stackebrandtia sp.]
MSTADTAKPRSRYAFRNSSEPAKTQLAKLEEFLDPITLAALAELDVKPGGNCLEIGPGRGSVARWMADRVGADGKVVAVDIDPCRIEARDNMEIRQQDIRDGVPGGPYDLIHARLVLMHIPERVEVLRALVDSLNPGGWLVLGEFGPEPLRVLAAPSQDDVEVFQKVGRTLLESAENNHGMSMQWAYEVHAAMADAELSDLHITEQAEGWWGGAGAVLHHSNSFQKEDMLLAAGITKDELDRYRELTLNPEFCARSYYFVNTRGRKAS